MSYNLAQLQNLSRQAGWPENQIAKVAAIEMYESSGDPNIVNNGSSTHTNEYSVGLLQINTLSHRDAGTIAQLQDPIYNLQYALRLWQGRPNWQDWYTSNNKYNQDYRGIASQSRAIYVQGGNSTDGNPLPGNDDTTTTTTGNYDALIIISVGVGALLFIGLITNE